MRFSLALLRFLVGDLSMRRRSGLASSDFTESLKERESE